MVNDVAVRLLKYGFLEILIPFKMNKFPIDIAHI